jgi:hypothetical protein
MPRFVILEHDHPHLHWDLMLEAGAVLRTWRLADIPRSGQVVRAEALGNHRRMYLDYEGPVSGNRGQVKRWDTGTFRWLVDTAELIVVQLEGNLCRGSVQLERATSGEWTLIYREGAKQP